ncbi:uncharacterized protein ColSpa_02450 [Colletotrichum spaethianum]|uniref:Uncharacterized protein n=1 Tax=Colletotrichum spaethianum TaxID=700344 RepID=A0AA37L934_9PEZI|nr:uncharacterized protein ColSpa_02450 [Colletotrichum spaethianum]GKT42269.1 hypothetical protein ColSpa_02450 [Colletotrichum spaethianum]
MQLMQEQNAMAERSNRADIKWLKTEIPSLFSAFDFQIRLGVGGLGCTEDLGVRRAYLSNVV